MLEKNLSLSSFWGIAICLVIFSGCTNTQTTTPPPTQVAQLPTQTPTLTATATNTVTPSPTATATATYTPTVTPTLTPSLTPTPTETNTPTATATATATLKPTLPPVTKTPTTTPTMAVTPHLFPETPMQDFDVDKFMNAVGRMRDTFRSMNAEINSLPHDPSTGAYYFPCSTYHGSRQYWITEALGLHKVPATWQPIYTEYRSLLQQAVSVTWIAQKTCPPGGAYNYYGPPSPLAYTPEPLNAEEFQKIVDFFTWAYPRSEEMVNEGWALPRP